MPEQTSKGVLSPESAADQALNLPIQLVLDTNVVLDWLLFADVSLDSLGIALRTGQARVLTHPFAVNELRRVLAYPLLRLATDRQAELVARYGQQTSQPALGFSVTSLRLPAGFPDCRDPDDQPFLALTYHSHAHALVTRDRQLLRLRKSAARFGVRIVDTAQLLSLLAQRNAP